MNKKILIVDDEKEIVDLLEVYLSNDGYSVYKCYNGLADTMGAIAVIECNAEQIKIEKTLNSNIAFVCATNTFHLPGMVGYNNDKIDNWFAEERYQTLYSAFSEKNGGFNFPFAEKLLSGDYGFLCQYDRSTGKDTVWSVIYDMKRHKIYRSEGNPRRHKFKEDIRFQF